LTLNTKTSHKSIDIYTTLWQLTIRWNSKRGYLI